MAGMVLAIGSSHYRFRAHCGKSQCLPSDFLLLLLFFSAHLSLATYCHKKLTGIIVMLEKIGNSCLIIMDGSGICIQGMAEHFIAISKKAYI